MPISVTVEISDEQIQQLKEVVECSSNGKVVNPAGLAAYIVKDFAQDLALTVELDYLKEGENDILDCFFEEKLYGLYECNFDESDDSDY